MSATPPKPPNRWRPDILLGQFAIARLVDFGLRWAFGAEGVNLFVDCGFQVFWLHIGTRGHGTFRLPRRVSGFVVALDRLGDLLFIDQFAVETAGLASAENMHKDVGIGVARVKIWRGQPRHRNPRQLDRIGHR